MAQVAEISGTISQLLDLPFVRAAALLTLRLLPIGALTPLFGGQIAPARFRFAAALLLAISAASAAGGTTSSPVPFWLLAVKESVLGLSMALVIAAMFDVYTATGKLIDDARGAGNAELFDPVNNRQESPLGQFLHLSAVCVFLASGGHRLLIDAVARSLEALPLFTLPSATAVGPAMVLELLRPIGLLMISAVQLAAPVMVLCLAVDVSLGMINRLAPQVQATVLGMGLKALAVPLMATAGLLLTMLHPMERFAKLLHDLLRATSLGGGAGGGA